MCPALFVPKEENSYIGSFPREEGAEAPFAHSQYSFPLTDPRTGVSPSPM